MKENISKNVLNRSLKVFFRDALRITALNPLQAFSFLRTLFWLKKAAKIRSLWKKEQNLHVPPIIIFSITNQCNLQCKGCYNQSFHQATGKELSDEKLRDITREAKELGVSFFVLAGGEPFMRPVILNIMKDYSEIIFLVFTNGLLIDETMIKQFKKQKNVVPLISLEGNEEETDERRGKGTYSRLIQTMQKMKKEKVFFGLSLTLTQQNFSTITNFQFTKNSVDFGCKFFLYLEYTPIQPGTENWVLTEGQRSEFLKRIYSYRAQFPALFIGVPWDEDDVGGCLSAGRGFIHINAAGDVEPCPFAPFTDANLKQTTLKDALQSKFLETIRAIPELSRETGGGCVLWKKRELVQTLLDQNL